MLADAFRDYWLLRLILILTALALIACSAREETPGATPTPPPEAEILTLTPVGATPTPAPRAMPRPTRTPAAQPIAFSFGAEVPDSERAIVQGGIDVAVRYLEAAVALPAAAARVYAYRDLAELQAAVLRSSDGSSLPVDLIGRRLSITTAESFPGNVFINTGSAAWQEMLPVHRFRTAAHEYFHIVQMHLLGPELTYKLFTTPVNQERTEGPSWLFEGGADWVSWKALEAAGLGSVEGYLAATPPSHDVDLGDLESYLEYFLAEEARIALSVAAVDRLLAGRGANELVEFYRRVGKGESWRAAFVSAFGRSVEQFYAEFRAYQSR
jgi:hypothetical protein